MVEGRSPIKGFVTKMSGRITLSNEESQSTQRDSWVILGCVSMIIMVVYVLMQAVSPLLPAVIEDFRASHSAGGFLYAVPIMMIAVFSYPLGIASDRLGSTKAIGLGAAIILLASLLRVFSSNFYLMLLFTGMFGFGFSLNFPNLSKTVKEHFPPHLMGKATAVYTAAIPFGGGLGIALTKPLFAAIGSWRYVLTIWTLIAIPLVSLSWIVMTRCKKKGPRTFQPPRSEQPSTGGTTKGYILATLICGLLLSLLNLTFFSTMGWLPTYLVEAGWPPVSAGAATSMISFVEVPGILLYPYLSDRTGRSRALITSSFFLIAVCLFTLSAKPSLAWALAPFLGISFGGIFVLLLAFPARLSRKERVGRAAGAILSIGYIGALVGPTVAGYLRDRTGGFSTGFVVMAVGAVLAVCLSFASPDSLHSAQRN